MSNPNVLLLVMDSVRAENDGHHGYQRDTTPFIDAFAEDATVHYQARSPGRWSLPSHASLFTGLHIAEHRLFDEGRRLRPGHTIFEELVDEHGYDTGVFSYNGYINGATPSGLDRFETVEGYRDPPFPSAADPQGIRGRHREYLLRCLRHEQPVRSLLNGLLMKLGWDYPSVMPDRILRNTSAGKTPDDVYTDLFLEWERAQTGPWAACINFMETHNAYRPNPEHDRWSTDRDWEIQESLEFGNWEYLGGQEPIENLARLESLYDGTIHQVDAHVRHVIETLEARGVLEDTLVVITGDHGEGFGEPDPIRPNLPTVQHVVGSHECLLHVPLVVKYPGQTEGVEVDSVASLTRFAEVVRAVVSDDWTPGEEFRPDDGRVVASTHGLNEVNWERMLEFCDGDTAKFEGETRIVYEDGDGAVNKFMNWGDRHVTVEVTDAQTSTLTDENNREIVEDVFATIRDRDVIDRGDDVGPVDEETERRLEALGYR